MPSSASDLSSLPSVASDSTETGPPVWIGVHVTPKRGSVWSSALRKVMEPLKAWQA